MINLKVGENNCRIPEKWTEVKLKDYEKLYALMVQNEFKEPEEKPTTEDAIDILEKERALHNVRINRKVFAELTGLSEEIINQTDVKQMNETITLMTNFLNKSSGQYEQNDNAFSFKHKGKTYFFPLINMESNTFGDYIETAQLEMIAQKQDAKKMSVVAEQMAILCREKGEVYNEQLVQKKTKMFRELNMDVVWKFIFFFEQTNKYMQEKFPNIFKDGNRIENRHAQKHWDIMKPYGWLNTLYDIAMTGLFTKNPDNAIDSVRNTNLYVVLTYLSWKSANNEYNDAVRNSYEEEQKIKQNARRNNKR